MDSPVRLSAAWVRPLDTDPGLLVDREAAREQLKSFVLDELDAGDGEARILIAGDRGVGKSIFGRTVLDEIAAERKQTVIAVHVDGRNRSELSFLKGFAARLATAGLELSRYIDKPALGLWFRQLALVANSDEFTESQAESIRREHGRDVDVGVTLMGALDARGGLRWKETRDLGQVVARTQKVDADLVVSAISHVLARVANAGLRVVVFHDDLDQAIDTRDAQGAKDARPVVPADHDHHVRAYCGREAAAAGEVPKAPGVARPPQRTPMVPEAPGSGGQPQRRPKGRGRNLGPQVPDALARILSARPCVSMAHIRNEALAAELRREFEETVELPGLGADVLFDLIEARAAQSGAPGQRALQVGRVREDLARLATVSDNSLAYLRWSYGYLRLYPQPPAPDDWTDRTRLAELVKRVGNLPVDTGMLIRLVDACARAVEAHDGEALQRQALLDTAPDDQAPLTEDDLEFLENAGVLIKRSRFEPDRGYRLDPVVHLLLPDKADRLRSA